MPLLSGVPAPDYIAALGLSELHFVDCTVSWKSFNKSIHSAIYKCLVL